MMRRGRQSHDGGVLFGRGKTQQISVCTFRAASSCLCLSSSALAAFSAANAANTANGELDQRN